MTATNREAISHCTHEELTTLRQVFEEGELYYVRIVEKVIAEIYAMRDLLTREDVDEYEKRMYGTWPVTEKGELLWQAEAYRIHSDAKSHLICQLADVIRADLQQPERSEQVQQPIKSYNEFWKRVRETGWNPSPKELRELLIAAESPTTPDKEQVQDKRVVPFNPTESQWSGLARDIVMWMDMHDGSNKTPRNLFDHLERVGTYIPQWLRDETEMKALDHVPSKGTRAAIIYKAMVSVYPQPTPISAPEQARVGEVADIVRLVQCIDAAIMYLTDAVQEVNPGADLSIVTKYCSEAHDVAQAICSATPSTEKASTLPEGS